MSASPVCKQRPMLAVGPGRSGHPPRLGSRGTLAAAERAEHAVLALRRAVTTGQDHDAAIAGLLAATAALTYRRRPKSHHPAAGPAQRSDDRTTGVNLTIVGPARFRCGYTDLLRLGRILTGRGRDAARMPPYGLFLRPGCALIATHGDWTQARVVGGSVFPRRKASSRRRGLVPLRGGACPTAVGTLRRTRQVLRHPR